MTSSIMKRKRCGLWKHVHTEPSHHDHSVVWNIVIANRLPLRKKKWIKLRKAVMEVTQMDDRHGECGLQLASSRNETEKLERWVTMEGDSRDKMNSVEELKRVLDETGTMI
jgi:hypothetical protein